MKKLESKTAVVVTGAASGTGRATRSCTLSAQLGAEHPSGEGDNVVE